MSYEYYIHTYRANTRGPSGPKNMLALYVLLNLSMLEYFEEDLDYKIDNLYSTDDGESSQ